MALSIGSTTRGLSYPDLAEVKGLAPPLVRYGRPSRQVYAQPGFSGGLYTELSVFPTMNTDRISRVRRVSAGRTEGPKRELCVRALNCKGCVKHDCASYSTVTPP